MNKHELSLELCEVAENIYALFIKEPGHTIG